MLTIYKYPLAITNSQFVQMPQFAEILSAGLDPQGALCVWAAVDTEAPMVSRQFYVVGTGNPVTPAPMEFIGSVTRGPFVWHVFEAVA